MLNIRGFLPFSMVAMFLFTPSHVSAFGRSRHRCSVVCAPRLICGDSISEPNSKVEQQPRESQFNQFKKGLSEDDGEVFSRGNDILYFDRKRKVVLKLNEDAANPMNNYWVQISLPLPNEPQLGDKIDPPSDYRGLDFKTRPNSAPLKVDINQPAK